MTDPDQCIICLEPLGDVPPSLYTQSNIAFKEEPKTETSGIDEENNPYDKVASLDGCNHIIHDVCIKLWAQKTNTCPICRETFRKVRVYDTAQEAFVTTYDVEDKKQTVEFDPQEWLAENSGEDDTDENIPCPVCNLADREEILLLCDGCDAAYHTECIGLDHIPSGNWYCMECADVFQTEREDTSGVDDDGARVRRQSRQRRRLSSRPSRLFPRTRERMRRARRQARSLEWQGPWGHFAGRVYEALQIDLDNHEDDDTLEDFRRSQQQRQREHLEYQRWQQRLNIASRLGAADVFANSLPPAARHHLQHRNETPQETRDEAKAWGALERAREAERSSPGSRKRKLPSATASPSEPAAEPERKLKRPRTRRLPAQGEASSSKCPGQSSSRPQEAGSSHSSRSPVREAPSFLNTLLKEVEMSTPSDDENLKNYFGHRFGGDAASPVATSPVATSPGASPSPSTHNSPRALSITPPPVSGRPSSPPLPLSSYVEPRFPPANYLPTRTTSRENIDAEPKIERSRVQDPEIRHPRPQRPSQHPAARSPDSSPVRQAMSPEAKASINGIVRSALKPHWHAQELTTEQYSNINRDVSRKLYEEIRDPSSLNGETLKNWEKIATKEVARAVADTKA